MVYVDMAEDGGEGETLGEQLGGHRAEILAGNFRRVTGSTCVHKPFEDVARNLLRTTEGAELCSVNEAIDFYGEDGSVLRGFHGPFNVYRRVIRGPHIFSVSSSLIPTGRARCTLVWRAYRNFCKHPIFDASFSLAPEPNGNTGEALCRAHLLECARQRL